MAGTESTSHPVARLTLVAGIVSMLVSLWLPSLELAGRTFSGFAAFTVSVETGVGLLWPWRGLSDVAHGIALLAAASLNVAAPWWAWRGRRVSGWVVATGVAAALYLALRVALASQATLLPGYFVWIVGIALLGVARRASRAP